MILHVTGSFDRTHVAERLGLGLSRITQKVSELQHLLCNMAYSDTDPASNHRFAAQLKMLTD